MPISIYKVDITKANSKKNINKILTDLQIHTIKRTVKSNNGIPIYNSKIKD